MTSAHSNSHLPAKPSDSAVERSQKCALQKDVLIWLEDKGLGWSRCTAESTGSNFVRALTDVLWYLDGHFATLASRGCPIPQAFELFSDYNQPTRSKHHKRDAENLNAVALDSHSCLLNEFILCPWLNSSSWKAVRDTLADSLHKYAEYLKRKNLENQSKLDPVRSPIDAEHYTFIGKSTWIKPATEAEFKALQMQLDKEETFSPVFVNDYAPANQRYSSPSVDKTLLLCR